MTNQTETTDNTGRAATARYNITNPTRADHVIYSVGGKRTLIPAGQTVENVEMVEHEASYLKDIHKKMGDGKFLSLIAAARSEDKKPPDQPDQSKLTLPNKK